MQENRRRHLRDKVVCRVDYVDRKGRAWLGLIRGLSVEGMFIEYTPELTVGDIVVTTFTPPGSPPFKLRAKVVRVTSTGAGLKFYADDQGSDPEVSPSLAREIKRALGPPIKVVMPIKKTRKRTSGVAPAKAPDVLDVQMTAELLMVSTDTVYSLFKRGDLPGRKVGRKLLTTRAAVLRLIESSSENDSVARAIEGDDRKALSRALNTGKALVREEEESTEVF